MISPFPGVELTKLSLNSKYPLPGPKWNDRETYFIYYAYGLESKPLNFSMDFTMSSNYKGHLMDIAVTTHHLFGDRKNSRPLNDLMKQFPSWTAVQTWTASYESWII
ncbi:hypothetical protein WA026_022431 [Henosepilachna vigintioctopunctata]